ncbi:MAG TPA: nitroreductase family protein [Perlabentimonas sp.]|nr:nitroreductase family protein [Perlabentimonas sp.]
MELKKAIETRASVRKYTPEPVNLTDIKEMVRLASLAPSVNNYQPWQFIAITNKELMNRMANAVREKIKSFPENQSKYAADVKKQVEYFATFFEEAPALVALCMSEYETVLEKGVELTHDEVNQLRNSPDLQSAGACIQNMLLAAVDLGYGACWMSAPMMAKKELEALLDITEPLKLVSFVAIGRPAKVVLPRDKKPIDEMFRIIA